MSAEALREGLLEPKDHVILALDRMKWEQAEELMTELAPYFGMIKANSIAQSPGWADANRRADNHNLELMADAKYKDTPRTMEDHVESTTLDGSRFITVHASAGTGSLEAAVKGRNKARNELRERLGSQFDPFVGTLLGITVLTSNNDQQCNDTYGAPVSSTVNLFATRSKEAGLEGVVSSGDELPMLQDNPKTQGLLKVIPGIVLDSSGPVPEGQNRVVSAYEAIKEGADFVVLGSAVTKASNQVEAAKEVINQVAAGLRDRAA